MASSGPNDPTAAVNDTTFGGSTNWVNPTYCFASDANYANINSGLGSSKVSRGLKATGFGFTIPAGSTINGIVAEVQRHRSDGGTAGDNLVKLVKAGSAVGNDKAAGGDYPTSQAYATYGNSSDLWGTSWSVSEVNASDFGLDFSASVSADPDEVCVINVNHIRITIHYTPSGGDAAAANMLAMF